MTRWHIDAKHVFHTRNAVLNLSQLEERCTPIVGATAVPTPLVPGDGLYEIYSGVVQLVPTAVGDMRRDFGGSGTLFRTNSTHPYGHHILTAAHVVTDDAGVLRPNNMNVFFDLSRGGIQVPIPISVPSQAAYIDVTPSYTGPGDYDDDIAILKLVDQDVPGPARFMVQPYTATAYQTRSTAVYDSDGFLVDDEAVNKIVTWAGYGRTGTGTTGFTIGMSGEKRVGQNKIEFRSWGGIFGYSSVFAADFDNGLAANDAFGVREWFSSDLGLGSLETITAPGDSGMPWFVNIAGERYIAGVHVAGDRYSDSVLWDQPDINANQDGTFGEVSLATSLTNWYQGFVLPRTKMDSYDIVLDMKYQVYGQSVFADDMTITARQVDGNLILSVDNGSEPSLDGIYYSAPVANIKSLTLRGSDEDDETFRIVGDLGLQGNIYIDGRGGKNAVIVDDSAAPPPPIGNTRFSAMPTPASTPG